MPFRKRLKRDVPSRNAEEDHGNKHMHVYVDLDGSFGFEVIIGTRALRTGKSHRSEAQILEPVEFVGTNKF